MRIFILLMLLSFNAFAAPYLISDTVPIDGTEPSSYTVTVNGISFASVPQPHEDGVRLYFDMAGKWVNGSNTVLVTAINQWGGSPEAPLAFTAGVPLAPTGLQIVE